MAHDRWQQSIDEAGLEAILVAARDQIDYPAEADLSAVVRQRIEHTATTASPGGDGQSAANDPVLISSGPIEQPTKRRWREIAMLAGGIAAAAILVVAVGLIFRGFGDDDTNTPAISPSPTPQPTATVEARAAAPEIPGYQLVATAGDTTIPDQPVKVLRMGDDQNIGRYLERYLVLEPALGRLIAYNADGEIDESWGDDGFSPPMVWPMDAALAPDGTVYAISRSGQTVWVLDNRGNLKASWEVQQSEPETSDESTSSRLLRPAIAVTGDVINVALRSHEVQRYDAAGNQLESLEVDPATLIDIDTSANGQLVALTSTEILRYDQEWQTVATVDISGVLIRLGTTPDGGYVVLDRNQASGVPSLTILNSQGVEQRTIEDYGAVDVATLPGVYGMPAVQPDGSILIPLPIDGQVNRLLPDGSSSTWIAPDDDPTHFRNLLGVAVVDQGTVLGLDFEDGNYVVRSFNEDGSLLEAQVASDLKVPVPPGSPFADSIHISAWPDGRFAIGMVGLNGIGLFGADGSLESTLRIETSADQPPPDGIAFPTAFTAGPDGSLFVLGQNGAVIQYARDGSPIETLPPTDDGDPAAILYQDGNLWAVADGKVFSMEEGASEWHTIFDLADPITEVAYGLAATPDGHLLVTAMGLDEAGVVSQKLLVFDQEGALQWGWPLIENSSQSQYLDIAVGPDGLLALSDLANGTIYLYQPTGDDLTPPQPVSTQQPVDEPTPTATPLAVASATASSTGVVSSNSQLVELRNAEEIPEICSVDMVLRLVQEFVGRYNAEDVDGVLALMQDEISPTQPGQGANEPFGGMTLTHFGDWGFSAYSLKDLRSALAKHFSWHQHLRLTHLLIGPVPKAAMTGSGPGHSDQYVAFVPMFETSNTDQWVRQASGKGIIDCQTKKMVQLSIGGQSVTID